jgi:hypothetical protein
LPYEQVRLSHCFLLGVSRYVAELDVSQRGLMEKDDWKNLGLANLDNHVVPATNADNATQPAMPTDKKL